MPVMNGIEATLKIRELEKSGELPRRTRIVGLTGNAQEDQVKETIQVRMPFFTTSSSCSDRFALVWSLQPTTGWNGCESASSTRNFYALRSAAELPRHRSSPQQTIIKPYKITDVLWTLKKLSTED